MKRTFITMLSVAFLVGTVGLAGCAKSDLISAPDDGRQMGFSTYVGGSSKGVTKDAFIVGDKFAVMATQSKNPWTNTDADWYMGSTTDPDNTYVTVTKSPNESDGVWRYSPIKLWPKEANVSFFAFSPVPVTGGETYGITDVKVTTGSPTMKFEVKADIKSQVDLLRAEALNKFEEEVQLDFNHALTRVSFAAKANVTDKQMVRLDKIELVGIKNKGTLKLYDNARTIGANNDLGGWTTEANVASYVPALSHEVVGIVPETLTAMTQDDQAMFMIPQKFTKGGAAKLKVEYSFSNDGGKKWVNNSKFEIDLGDYTEYWNPSKNYRYVLTLSPANVYSFSASIVDWDSEISVSVKDALSITKLDAAREATTTTPYEFTVTTSSTQWKGYTLSSDQAWVKISDKPDGSGAAATKEYTADGVTKADYELEKKWYVVVDENLTPLVRNAKITLTRTATGLAPLTIDVAQKTFDLDFSDKPANTYVCKPTDKGFIFDAGKRPRTKNGTIGVDVFNTYSDWKPANVSLSWQTGKDYGSATGIANMLIRSMVFDAASGKCAVALNGFVGNAALWITASPSPLRGVANVWVTEGDITSGPEVNGVRFMDRNLGALAATSSKPAPADAYKYFGNGYQWGTAKAFVGQGKSTTASIVYIPIYNASGVIISNATGGYSSVSNEAYNNPATYIYENITNLHNRTDLGMAFVTTPQAWSSAGEKSMHDPCPYGYRVPRTTDVFAGFKDGQTLNSSAKIENGYVWNSFWWPQGCGLRSPDATMGGVGSNVYYWVSEFIPSKDGKAFSMVTDDRIATVGSYPTAYPFNVRCVVE